MAGLARYLDKRGVAVKDGGEFFENETGNRSGTAVGSFACPPRQRSIWPKWLAGKGEDWVETRAGAGAARQSPCRSRPVAGRTRLSATVGSTGVGILYTLDRVFRSDSVRSGIETGFLIIFCGHVSC